MLWDEPSNEGPASVDADHHVGRPFPYTSPPSPVRGMVLSRLLYLRAALDGPQERHPRAMIILLITIAVVLICFLAFVNR